MRSIQKLNWIKKIDEEHYEMFLDHHMLSTWRMCQAHFQLLHVEGRRPKMGYSWPLEFGALLHQLIEDIYNWKKDGTFSTDRLTTEAYHKWDEKNMDRFLQHKTCKALGGKLGFIALVQTYAQYYTQDNERLRIIGTEIGFGFNKEVPLGTIRVAANIAGVMREIIVDCYLSGRIDFLADDGLRIGPVDHKTRANFGVADLGAPYNPHEGMTGYIYATRQFIRNHPELSKKKVSTAWMNFIQVAHEPDPLKRFRRVMLMRTDFQLEQFRMRQLKAFKEVFEYIATSELPTWNTEVCAHWFGNDCIYRPVHRQGDEQSQLVVLNSDYTVEDYWNPEEFRNGKTVPRDNSTDKTTVPEQNIQYY